MEVGTVTSSLYSQQAANAQARPRQPETQPTPPQSQQPQQSQQTQSAARLQTAAAAQPTSENEAAERSRSEAEQARPTVNANGQTVGTRVNTTA